MLGAMNHYNCDHVALPCATWMGWLCSGWSSGSGLSGLSHVNGQSIRRDWCSSFVNVLYFLVADSGTGMLF